MTATNEESDYQQLEAELKEQLLQIKYGPKAWRNALHCCEAFLDHLIDDDNKAELEDAIEELQDLIARLEAHVDTEDD